MRPKIICHMMSSIDGRLLTERWTRPAAGMERSALMRYYDQMAERFGAEGWIVGRKSMEPFTRGTAQAVREPVGNLRQTYVGDRRGRNLAVSIDPRGKLHYGQDNAGGDHIVAVVGQEVPDSYLVELQQDGVSYILAGADGEDLSGAMETLGNVFGVKTLLLEGGGITNGYFLQAGLIDEISLLIYPGVDGLAGVPSIFEYMGKSGEKPAEGRSLRHVSTETLDGGMIYIRYQVERNDGDSAKGP